MLTIILTIFLLITTTKSTNNCQCGVFLLTEPPLKFSASAEPILAGSPVPTTCTIPSTRTDCLTICRRLIQSLDNTKQKPLFQSIILQVSKTLVCSKLSNITELKVPLPRSADDNNQGTFALPRSVDDVKWLGGFYRWCSIDWIYVGSSLEEPICCGNGNVAGRCPHKNLRSPRLIIKKRPDDDLSEEDDTTDQTDAIEDISFEQITTTPTPIKSSQPPLNNTIILQSFAWLKPITQLLGMNEFIQGLNTVLPTTTSLELIKRIDNMGFLRKYTDNYSKFGHEYNLGYCYVEYGVYNYIGNSEGGFNGLVNRLFGKEKQGVSYGVDNMFGGKKQGVDMGASKLVGQVHQQQQHPQHMSEPGLYKPPQHMSEPGLYKPPQHEQWNYPKQQISQDSLYYQEQNILSRLKRSIDNSTAPRQQSNPINLLNMASLLLQMNEDSSNTLPILNNIITNPAIHSIVNNLVTSFLTPPATGTAATNIGSSGGITATGTLTGSSGGLATQKPVNEDKQPEKVSHQQQQEPGLSSMLGTIVQTYLKHYFTSEPAAPKQPKTAKPTLKPIKKQTTTTPPPIIEEKSDIVETISEVAKPFFLSYFGLLPDQPGYGQLAQLQDRTSRDTLTYDPDPGTSLQDIFLGSINLPSTGNIIYDFGNRIVFSFNHANDPTHGLYCFKQYTVNKLWDGFRFSVRALFK